MSVAKRLFWILAALGLLTFIAGLGLYLYGGLPLFIKLANRPVSEPTEVEYSVYSSFIDELFSTNQPSLIGNGQESIIYIADRTLEINVINPLPPLLGVNAFNPEQDFYQQNIKSWRLQPGFHTRIKWALVELGSPSPLPKNPAVSGVLEISRIGLDWSRTKAMLTYRYSCGSLCGQGGEILLQKDSTHWRVTEWGPGWVS